MKKTLLFTLFLLGLTLCLFQSNSNGRASSANWGNTAAPGDETFVVNGQPRTCQSCHNGSTAFQVTLDIDVIDQAGSSILNTGYVPGTIYEVRTTINPVNGTPNAYGYQIVCLDCTNCTENDSDINAWSDPADNVKIAFANNTGRTYAEHKGVNSNNVFSVNWTAPNVEGVTFYSCGNGVNKDGDNGSGDNSACNNLTLLRSDLVSTNDVEDSQVSFSISPTPATSYANVEVDVPLGGQYDLSVIGLNGNTVFQQTYNFPAGQQTITLNTIELIPGLYIAHFSGQQSLATQRLVISR